MKANTALRFRLYPTSGQAERLMSWSHVSRAVWNTALAQRIWAYRSAQRVTLREVDQCVELTQARNEHDWLRDLPAQCAQQVLRQLDDAYANFWNPNHPAGHPAFKKKSHPQRITFPGRAIQVRKVSRRTAQVWLPKLGWIAFRLSRPIDGTVRNATVSRDGLGSGSSQTCSRCGVRDPESRQGCGRLFACVHCGHTEHADRNAALNILDRALCTAGWAGASISGGAGSQSTRSPQRGRGTRTGSRMREPTSRGTAA